MRALLFAALIIGTAAVGRGEGGSSTTADSLRTSSARIRGDSAVFPKITINAPYIIVRHVVDNKQTASYRATLLYEISSPNEPAYRITLDGEWAVKPGTYRHAIEGTAPGTAGVSSYIQYR